MKRILLCLYCQNDLIKKNFNTIAELREYLNSNYNYMIKEIPLIIVSDSGNVIYLRTTSYIKYKTIINDINNLIKI